jgi:hypothetical protein
MSVEGSTPELAEVTIRNSVFFDADFYRNAYPDVASSGMDPALHYLLHGALEGRNPGPNFSAKEYLDQNPCVAASGINALVHYELSGREEGRHISSATAGQFDSRPPHEGGSMPLPPPLLRERVSGTTDEIWFVESGKRSLDEWANALAAIGTDLRSFQSILDFGCGCGRTLRWMAASALPTQRLEHFPLELSRRGIPESAWF